MKKIEYIIKTNKFVQSIYVFFGTIFFRFIGLFVRIDKNLIIFNSFSGKLFNDSPRVLYEEIISNEKYKNYRCVWAFCDLKAFKDKVNCKIVKQDSFKYFVTAMKAKYWITNVNIQRGLKIKRKGNICLDTWHGTGPKTIGNSVKGRKDYNFSNINYILADGPFLRDAFINSFNARSENVHVIGRPREDILFDYKDKVKEARAIYVDKFNLPKDKIIILFAPTWRESGNGGKSYDIGFSFDLEKWAKILGDKYLILFRAHSITNNYKIPNLSNVIDVTSVENINELYLASDILISDYSSCYTDFSILSKPMLCYAPDYDEYCATRGLVYDLNPLFTSGVIKDEDVLLNAIKNIDFEKECDNSRKFNYHFVTCDGNATEKSLALLFSDGGSK